METKHDEILPAWWTAYHESAWDRVREALRRDWEQTKADLTWTRGHDLHQGLTDTVKQALGADPLPMFTQQPTAHPIDDHWYRVVHAVRYGYAAFKQYDEQEEWDEELEQKLRAEWEDLMTNHDWDVVKEDIRWGWQGAREISARD